MIVFWILVILAALIIGVIISHFWGTGIYNKTENFINTYTKEDVEKEKKEI